MPGLEKRIDRTEICFSYLGMAELFFSKTRARRLDCIIEQIKLAGVIGWNARSVARCEGGALLSACHLAERQVRLGLPIAETDVLVLDHLTGDDARFQIEGPAVPRPLGWNYIDLLNRIVDFKSQSTGIAEVHYDGTIAGRPEVFEQVSACWRVLTRSDRNVGFSHTTQLSAAAYGKLRAERLGDDETTHDHMEALDLQGKFYVALPSVAIDRSFHSLGTFALLIGSLLEAICGMVLRGVALTSACFQECTSKWCRCVADPALMKSPRFRVRRCVLRSLRSWSYTSYFNVQLQV